LSKTHHSLRQQGIAIARSAGVVVGFAQKLDQKHQFIQEYKITQLEVSSEIKRLHLAIKQAEHTLQQEITQLSSHQHAHDFVPILEAHRMMLQDPELLAKTELFIENDRINAEWALKKCLHGITQAFDKIEDVYLRSRKTDVEHVVQRIFDCLVGEQTMQHQSKSIMIAMDFSPAEIVAMWRLGVSGFVSIQGGENSHAMIVARGVGLPGIAGVHGLFEHVEDGHEFILDAEEGLWVHHPEQQDYEHYSHFQTLLETEREQLQHYAGQTSRSADGYLMPLMANLEFVEEVEVANTFGVDGVGLFRTEFLFMQVSEFPDEETQFQYYVQVVKGMQGKPITFRLLDMGADKLAQVESLKGIFDGENPALGLRGVRLLLRNPEALKTQLRAIVRTAALGPVSILVPMVTAATEMEAVRLMLDVVQQELSSDANIQLGCMIEVPAAAFIADELAKKADFFSIGSNDLVQYSLAVDRTDENVGYLYDANHPAVVALIKMAVRAANLHNIPVSICGELAGNPAWTQSFLDLKVTSLSMSSRHVLPIRRHLHHLRALS